MQRALLIGLAAVVVAAGIAATATIVLMGDDDTQAVASPALSPIATAQVEGSVETSSPGFDGTTRTETTAWSERPAATVATASPRVEVSAARDVDCQEDPAFCSSVDEMAVAGGRLDEPLDEAPDTKRESRPTITMRSRVLGPDEGEASEGEEVGSIHVEVVVSNSTESTFVFAKREIVLEIFKGGRLYDSYATKGDGFDMTPGSKMTGTFDRPITQDGTYTWRAKVWYYER